jgi:FkbM family methyltransferase
MTRNLKWPFYSFVILPYTRLELPAWGRLMAAFGVNRNELWACAPRLQVRGKYHGYIMALDASDQADRTGYFLSRFYDLATQLFMREAIFSGDTVVDVGANIGMITLLASRLVGSEGRVLAFEPNADVYRRLQRHVQHNRLGNVSLYPVGLGDAEANLTLKVWAKNKGWGTFGKLSPEEQSLLTAEYEARVVPGDDSLDIPTGTALTIKIDVEGFECQVLRGLSKTLGSHRPAVITEILAENLGRAGFTPHELFDIMFTYGYRAFGLDVRRRHLRYHLCLRAILGPDEASSPNVVWLYPGGTHWKRLPNTLFC